MSQAYADTVQAWLQGQSTPLLPALDVARLYLRLSWAAVVLAITWAVLGRIQVRDTLGPGARRLGALALVVVTCLPAPWGLASWLGLAFQSPSVLTTLVCLWLAGQSLWPMRVPPLPTATLAPWYGVAVVWAAVLLLDVLACFPFSLYAWGFNPLAMGLLSLLACLPWLLGRNAVLSGLLVASLLVHALLRLPTGNLWDVWVDPGLAAWLLLLWLRARIHAMRSRRRGLQQPFPTE